MPAKEIKELRQAGKLEEALNLAKTELEADPANIWPKRNISWVYYDYIKQNTSPEHFSDFISWLTEINKLDLPADEVMLFDHLSWQVGKVAFALLKTNPIDHQKSIQLFETIKSFHFQKPGEGYSFLFKGMHKVLKDTDRYLSFADWWGFENFMPVDFEKEKLPDGKEFMAVAEQAFITYAKHLLPKHTPLGDIVFDREKVESFLPVLSGIAESHPRFQYPPYFIAKLLLALGDKDNVLDSLLPFARKKRNDFWVWEIIAEAFANDSDKVFACYCKALSCRSPEEMLVSLRQKMAAKLISMHLYNEAKTEIELLVNARNAHSFKIPVEVVNWQSQEWYGTATAQKSNLGFYKQFSPIAESLLFRDTPEETIIVDNVNTEKKMLNFIASESKFGFFKYERFINKVNVGETLKVRFQSGSEGGIHQVYTVIREADDDFRRKFIKPVSGKARIKANQSFGFIDDVFIHPATVKKMDIKDGMEIHGEAIKSYNTEKKNWGWKLISNK